MHEGDERARSLPTGTVTFLLSDVEGSTRLWEADGDGAAAAIARHYELFDAAISLHGGVRPEEQGEGDSVVGAFALASDALGQSYRLRISNAALRTVDYKGGLDVFLMGAKDEKLSTRALKIKKQVKAKLANAAPAAA